MPSAATHPRLTAEQERHMREMHVEAGDPPMIWTTRRESAQYRCAEALVAKGLLQRERDGSSWGFNNPAFSLTDEGVAVVEELWA